MALGSPIALVGIIITAINTGKENTSTFPTSPTSSNLKIDAKTETVIKTGINICDVQYLITDSQTSSLEGTDYRVRKGTELCVDQSTADTVRSRRHLGGVLFQFSRPSFCAVRESVEVV